MSEYLSLTKIAYYLCSAAEKRRYDKLSNSRKIDLKSCCGDLILGRTVNAMIVCAKAAYNGHLDCLKHARSFKCRWDVRTPIAACKSGQLECLKWAFENGCEWTEEVTWTAVVSNQLDCLKYALENNCPINVSSCYKVAVGNSKMTATEDWKDMLEFLNDLKKKRIETRESAVITS